MLAKKQYINMKSNCLKYNWKPVIDHDWYRVFCGDSAAPSMPTFALPPDGFYFFTSSPSDVQRWAKVLVRWLQLEMHGSTHLFHNSCINENKQPTRVWIRSEKRSLARVRIRSKHGMWLEALQYRLQLLSWSYRLLPISPDGDRCLATWHLMSSAAIRYEISIEQRLSTSQTSFLLVFFLHISPHMYNQGPQCYRWQVVLFFKSINATQ